MYLGVSAQYIRTYLFPFECVWVSLSNISELTFSPLSVSGYLCPIYHNLPLLLRVCLGVSALRRVPIFPFECKYISLHFMSLLTFSTLSVLRCFYMLIHTFSTLSESICFCRPSTLSLCVLSVCSALSNFCLISFISRSKFSRLISLLSNCERSWFWSC